jgi:hypothetical protein
MIFLIVNKWNLTLDFFKKNLKRISKNLLVKIKQNAFVFFPSLKLI